MTDLLSPDELQDLTGYRRKAYQVRWLRAWSVPFMVDRWNRPRVLRSEVERMLSAPSERHSPADDAPNLEHIRRKAG